MELVIAWGRSLAVGLFTVGWVCMVLWRVERLWPRGERPGRLEILKAAKFWAIFLLADAVVYGTFRYYGSTAAPLFSIRAPLSQLPFWAYAVVGPFAFLFLYDFFNYWMHRAQHKWFWKQHRIHHSITKLSAFNSYFHPTEPLFRLASIYIPMTLLFGYGAGGWTVAAMLLSAVQSYYVHSPTRLNYGPLRAVIVDNAFHRIHHSVEHQHFDRNFGAFTTIWDRFFGTAYFPAKEEWPDTGVCNFAEVETIKEYISTPFSSEIPEGCGTIHLVRPSA